MGRVYTLPRFFMKSQIISVSRRSDIPAFYGDWFMHQIKAGFCNVPNPINKKQISYISLHPKAVDCFVFWTKYPTSLIPHLSELQKMKYPFYFLFTVNSYDDIFEKKMPRLEKRLAIFQQLTKMIGKKRVIWRYDPIIVTQDITFDFHIKNFSYIASKLAGNTEKVIISFYDEYAKTRNRMQNYSIVNSVSKLPKYMEFLQQLKKISTENDLIIQSCCNTLPIIERGKCVDNRLIEQICGSKVSNVKDKGQRLNCLCVKSRDIGSYNTCKFECEYCYAIR